MRVRRQTATGDYTFGQGSLNFFVNSPLGVAQTVQTRLRLWEGEWFLDKTAGTPYAQEILGYGTQALYDAALKAIILDTNGVTEIVSYQSELDDDTRQLTVGPTTIMTAYSAVPVVVPAVVL